MLLVGFWALAALLDPTRPAQLVLGLAVVAAALLVAVAAGLPVLLPVAAAAVRTTARRARVVVRSRLADPTPPGAPGPGRRRSGPRPRKPRGFRVFERHHSHTSPWCGERSGRPGVLLAAPRPSA